MVGEERLELSRETHMVLSHARIPIPPLAHREHICNMKLIFLQRKNARFKGASVYVSSSNI